MNTTPTPPPAKSTDIPRWAINDIVPSPFQSRRDFNPEKLQEMAGSITEHGIIQPITLRQVSPTGPLELVCGERRLRAGKLAGLETVPYILRELTDAQAENIVLTENIQREDLKPSEEATHYDRLLKIRTADGALMHTRDSVAKLASKTLNYIDDHLKLLVCPESLQQAVDKNEVALSVAMVVGRIPGVKERAAAAEQVLKPSYQEMPLGFKQARELVREKFMVSLAGVPWALDDASLVPVKYEDVEGVQVRCSGGACVDCPFLSANIEGANVTKVEGGRAKSKRQAGGASASLCTLPKCHGTKLDAVCRQQKVKALEGGLKVLDDKEATKQFHPSRHEVANGAKYVWLDAKPEYHEVGNLSYSANGRIWRTLIKGSGVAVVMARNPHTGQLVEMALVKDAKPVGEKVLRMRKDPEAEKTKTPKQLKEEADAKLKRAAELLQGKIDAITLPLALTEIRTCVERKGADAELLEEFCEMALARSGSDGTQFLADVLQLPRDKKAGSYGLDKPLKKKMKELCEDRVPAWMGMLALVLMSSPVGYHGLEAECLKSLLGVLGIRLPEIAEKARAQFEGTQKAKAGKGKAPKAAVAAKNSTDKSGWTADGEASKTAAADARAKQKQYQSKKDLPAFVADLLGRDVTASEPTAIGEFLATPSFFFEVSDKVAFSISLAQGSVRGWWSAGSDHKIDSKTGHRAVVDHRQSETRTDALVNEVTYLLGIFNASKALGSAAKREAQSLAAEILKDLKSELQAIGSLTSLGPDDDSALPVKAGESSLKAGAAKAAADGQVDSSSVAVSVPVCPTVIVPAKIGKPEAWTAADVDAGALLLKKGTHKMTDLIGSPPVRSEKIKLKNYNAVRVRLMRKQKQIKLPKAEKVKPEGEQGALPL